MMLRLLSRYWLLLPLLLLAIVARNFVEEPDGMNLEETIDMRTTEADYYLEDFTTHKYDSDGNLEFRVHGSSLSHFPVDDRSEIVKPEMIMHRENVTWQIASQRGQFVKNTEVITLQGDVIIQRGGLSQSGAGSMTAIGEQPDGTAGAPVRIHTSELSVLTALNEVRSEQAVRIVADSWQLNSTGLQSDIDEGKLVLLSEVSGRYEVTGPADDF